MKKTRVSIPMVIFILIFIAPNVFAEVQWRINQTLTLEKTPLDTAVSNSGKYIFVLTETGKIHIYRADGTLRDTIDVGTHVDGIRTGSNEDALYLQSRQKKAVEVLLLDFIHDFDLTGSPVKGPPDAPVIIVEFSDFQCAYCSRLTGLLDQVLEKNPETVKLVFKHFPLQNHAFAVKAAMASMAAHAQGEFWPFHDQLFKNYNQLNDNKIEAIARELGFEKETFSKEMENPVFLNQIKRDYRQGVEAGVRGTPTLYINGKLVRDRSLNGIQAIIDNVLKSRKEKP